MTFCSGCGCIAFSVCYAGFCLGGSGVLDRLIGVRLDSDQSALKHTDVTTALKTEELDWYLGHIQLIA